MNGDGCFAPLIFNRRGKKGVDHITGGRLCADIGNLFVVFALWRLGIGTSLLQYAEDQCAARGLEFVGLGVEVEDTGSHRLYQRLGYKDTEVVEHCCFDVFMEDASSQTIEEDSIYMIKRLGVEEAWALEGRGQG